MNRKLLFFTCCFFIHLYCFAQQPAFAWAGALGSTGFNEGGMIATDVYGNVFTAGQFDGTGDFDPGPGVYNLTSIATATNARNIFISKLSPLGNFLWAKSWANPDYETVYAIAVDAPGNVYISGSYSGTIDFDPGPGVFNMSAPYLSNDFILKLDAAGNFMWAKQIGNGTGTHSSIAIHNSTLYFFGDFTGTVDVDPGPGIYNLSSALSAENIFLEKLDTAGNFMSVCTIGGSTSTAAVSSHIVVDAAENIYLTGSISGGAVDLDPGPGVYNLSPPNLAFLLKLDASFNFVWAASIGNVPGVGTYESIAVDATGNVYITGSIKNTSDFDPGPGIYNLTSVAGSYDFFVCKLNAAGGLVWANLTGSIGLDETWGIALDNTGNVYVIGQFQDTVDFDPGPNVYNIISASRDIFILKMNPLGNLLWAKGFGTPGGNGFGLGISIDSAKNIYATGGYSALVDFDPGPGTFNLAYTFQRNAFVLKLSQPPVIPLTLLDFSARALTSGQAELNWETAQEENTDKYIIERSTDQRNYAAIGTVTAAGNSTIQKNYFYNDKAPVAGTNFYRLKMMDIDRSFTYSKIEVVHFKTTTLHIYPNPAKTVVQIDASGNNTSASLKITDAAGKLVKLETIQLNGRGSFSIDIRSLARGKYFVTVESYNNVETGEFIKL